MVKNSPISFGSDRPCITCKLLRETEKAFLIEYEGEEIWMPKSQSEMYTNQDGTKDLFAEEWILKEKGIL